MNKRIRLAGKARVIAVTALGARSGSRCVGGKSQAQEEGERERERNGRSMSEEIASYLQDPRERMRGHHKEDTCDCAISQELRER